ncbi:MAG: chemotaxis-specific protein-glutamate methyltransferase CheB [Lachnospiraceae bacterium]|nr:chemotaxis-specific protein-glutamate methyltransferase CheB [Lachnospiraceae bacterium]
MKKNILIVDDSALMRRVISDIINSDGRFEIVDYAVDGLEAMELLTKNSALYDAVLLDVNMPKMNGLDVLVKIQPYNISSKIIMVSTLVQDGAKETILALERGAFDFVLKPVSARPEIREEFKQKLIASLEMATGLDSADKVSGNHLSQKTAGVSKNKLSAVNKSNKKKLVAIACSTGGPKALKEVIPFLPESIDAPILLVQHMPVGFTASLAQRLDEISDVRVKEAEHGDMLEKGTVYIAPGGRHFRVTEQRKGGFQVALSDEAPREGLRPCANIMYESLAGMDFDQITCVVLTGMGADGTIGIDRLSQKNHVYVIAQDEKTCVVYGMPKAIASAGLADEILPLNRIADAIIKNVGVLNDGR